MISETLLYPDGFSKKKQQKTAHKVTLKNGDSINNFEGGKDFERRILKLSMIINFDIAC